MNSKQKSILVLSQSHQQGLMRANQSSCLLKGHEQQVPDFLMSSFFKEKKKKSSYEFF
jgi:hypothetical protein